VQTCIWPSWCHCHSLSLASVKSRLVLPFWYRLTRVVLEKGPLNGCVCGCVVSVQYTCVMYRVHTFSWLFGPEYLFLFSFIAHYLFFFHSFSCLPFPTSPVSVMTECCYRSTTRRTCRSLLWWMYCVHTIYAVIDPEYMSVTSQRSFKTDGQIMLIFGTVVSFSFTVFKRSLDISKMRVYCSLELWKIPSHPINHCQLSSTSGCHQYITVSRVRFL